MILILNDIILKLIYLSIILYSKIKKTKKKQLKKPNQKNPITLSAVHHTFKHTVGRQHRKYINLNLKPFGGNNNINNYIFHTKKNVQFKTSNTYLLLLLLLYRGIYNIYII